MKIILRTLFTIAAAMSLFAFLYSATNTPRIEKQEGKTCAVYAVANAIEFEMKENGASTPNGGFDKEILIEECKKIDDRKSGIYIATVLDAIMHNGLYALGADTTKDKPYCNITSYSAIQIRDIKKNVEDGKAVIIDTNMQNENWEDGTLEYTSQKTTGKHATFLFDYNEDSGTYIGANSWGKSWGFNGCYRGTGEWLRQNATSAYTVTI